MVTTKATFGYTGPESPVRVTMLAKISGTRNGQDWPDVGEDIDLPADEALTLISHGTAKPAPEPVERATPDEPAPERAVVPTTTKRKR